MADDNHYEVVYRCEACGHRQTLRVFNGAQPPPILNCMGCRAGCGVDYQQQLAMRLGMLPIFERVPPTAKPH